MPSNAELEYLAGGGRFSPPPASPSTAGPNSATTQCPHIDLTPSLRVSGVHPGSRSPCKVIIGSVDLVRFFKAKGPRALILPRMKEGPRITREF